eukprot:2797117-Rhodomonas_salina.1
MLATALVFQAETWGRATPALSSLLPAPCSLLPSPCFLPPPPSLCVPRGGSQRTASEAADAASAGSGSEHSQGEDRREMPSTRRRSGGAPACRAR